MKQTDYINVRVDKTTHHQLKMLAAIRQESMLKTLGTLIEQEWHKALASVPGQQPTAAAGKNQRRRLS